MIEVSASLARPLLLVVLSSAIWPASAVHGEPIAPPSDADAASAKQHFERGRELFVASQYLEALHEFEAGYRLAPLPLFLYNMGQACRHAGLIDQAIENYESYLQAVPDAPERAEVEQYLRELRAAKPQPPVQKSVAVTAPAGPGPRTASRDYRWYWYGGLLAVVAAGSVTAIVWSSGHGAPHTDLGNLQVHSP